MSQGDAAEKLDCLRRGDVLATGAAGAHGRGCTGDGGDALVAANRDVPASRGLTPATGAQAMPACVAASMASRVRTSTVACLVAQRLATRQAALHRRVP